MPRRIFKNLVIATAGPLPGQLTVDNLRQWTSIRKGTFTEEFDEQVTHLLCTREQFDRKLPRIKEALAHGKRQHIVHCDWFEISAVNEKREPEREYSMRNIIAKQNAEKRERARIERGKREGERAVNTNFFHVYSDRTFFSYQIDITRNDVETGELGQRYTLAGGKPVGRRLRFCYEYCLEINAQLRGLPWPPVEDTQAKEDAVVTEPQDITIDFEDHESTTLNEKAVEDFGTCSEVSVDVNDAEKDVLEDEGEADKQEALLESDDPAPVDPDVSMTYSE